ncbi:hypothetical protein [Nocardioides sp. WS12]|uniref:COG1470 family protein n=1 Tax=Nocardioides sp. WS12 TaxID=2486272 RepID=UPI0015FBD400|nr:hypothetical protein [Nocardioides sp. WS12]
MLKHWTGRSRLLLTLLAVLLVASVGSAPLRTASTTVGTELTLTATQSTVGVALGGNAVVAVAVSGPGSLLGPVNLSVTGAPSASVVTILPNPVPAGLPAVISVLTSGSTPVGTHFLKITATNGASTTTVTVKLVVTLPTGFTMTLAPPLRTVVDGETTSFTLNINRGLLAGPIGLTLSGVPQYATATVSPSLSILGNTATITIRTATNVVPGTYLITVAGKSLLSSATASAYLVVLPQTYPNFPVSGDPDRELAPGAPEAAIDMEITNPFDAAMTVSNIGVTIEGTDTSSQPGGCAVDNFEILAYGGPATLVVPPNSTRTLSQLGVARADWPAIRMLNTSANQDMCKGVDVDLRLNAKGAGA